MKIYQSIEELVGHTPLLRLGRLAAGKGAQVLVKLERMNPAGSVKDRVALKMLDDAQEKGLLRSDSVIIEPTSGNTGVGLAAIGAARGYRVILTMPETMSRERQLLLKAYGAQVVLTSGALGMKGAIEKVEELAAQYPHSFIQSLQPGGSLRFHRPGNLGRYRR